MRLERAQPLSLQLEDGRTIAVGGVDLERDIDTSYLRNVVGVDGSPVSLLPGTKVTLLSGESVLFVGIVQEDASVKDYLSCNVTDEGFVEL